MSEQNDVQQVSVPEAEFDDIVNPQTKYSRLKMFIKGIRSYQKVNYDNIIIISGSRGDGKTTSAIQIARWYNAVYFPDEKFDVSKYIVYNENEVKDKIMNLQPRAPLVCDEAVRFAMGQDWAQSENKEIIQLFAQMRTKQLTTIMCIPKMSWSQKKIQQMSTFWIKIYDRGFAVVFRPDKSEFADMYHLDELRTLEKSFFAGDDVETLMHRIRTHPCYFDEFSFPALPQEVEDKYMKLRDSYVFDTSTKETESSLNDPKERYKWLAYWLVKKEKFSPQKVSDLSFNLFEDKTMLSANGVGKIVGTIENIRKTKFGLREQDMAFEPADKTI